MESVLKLLIDPIVLNNVRKNSLRSNMVWIFCSPKTVESVPSLMLKSFLRFLRVDVHSSLKIFPLSYMHKFDNFASQMASVRVPASFESINLNSKLKLSQEACPAGPNYFNMVQQLRCVLILQSGVVGTTDAINFTLDIDLSFATSQPKFLPTQVGKLWNP